MRGGSQRVRLNRLHLAHTPEGAFATLEKPYNNMHLLGFVVALHNTTMLHHLLLRASNQRRASNSQNGLSPFSRCDVFRELDQRQCFSSDIL